MSNKVLDTYYKNNRHIWVLVLSGAVIGTLVGLFATFFQLILDSISELKKMLFSLSGGNLFIKIIMSVSLTITMVVISILIVRKFAKEAGGSGIQEVEGALKGCRKLRKRVVPVKFVSGLFSLGSGLSLGKEGPSIHMAAALAQFFVDRFKLTKKYANAVISAGAGAGLAAAFNTPLSGIVFVIEEMNRKFRFSVSAIKCVLVACIMSTIVSRAIMGNPPAIRVETFSAVPQNTLWLFMVLGIIFGYFGLLFNKSIIKVANFFSDGSKRRYWTLVITVCIVFGVGVVLSPNAVGGGYIVIANALDYNLSIKMLLVLFALRFAGVIFSYGTGVTGGIFAPMIALGTVFGLAYGLSIAQLFPEYNIDAGIFAVAGMSALFTATVGAPLTGIVLVMEMTWNFHLLLPLMITCFSASMLTYIHHQKPIYDTLLRRTISNERKQQAKEKNERNQKSAPDTQGQPISKEEI
ncbi:H(+)/Cl(-) exchange transporter ClcA [Francisella noatunensis]|uniref:H(+)/Cl(-) exchange transporter ClcA n=1 Tax=Francisella noatunensis TaxID=657445 RepID=A0A9Q2KYV0_9GAMM|nr:H(+)/Cl(-) exchange transporter ClcA [Francisella noatunensis]MBK2029103.1 H(+)/Cl(-) exchange transporter ClcA [Francisella noatunensis]MBK2033552.1 H(+)/Cl(-) exchange transporter ClcA [Francisella noatunensis]MBK2048728.1 H(+)/Cl(-) exchange transporter ClcA [Francisella noatunensis]MBK2049614.1 H(+)/Cl(-) exchange transporter ClcA [Francisella noatunensis]MBK2051993.1 H(+)/Cl(-) exchange transporter ClcA [Francisella noatunensis]